MKKLLIFSILFLSIFGVVSGQSAIHSAQSIHHPVVAKNGMVATQHGLASQVGLDILNKGGNALDAALAVGFALAVVLPMAGNLCGGGFMLIYDAKTGKTTAINYREMAPKDAFRDMYLDSTGMVDEGKFNMSYLSIGVPGTVAGMEYALKKYGTMSMREVLAPAIKLAKKGFPITYELAHLLKKYEKRLKACPATAEVFYKKDGYYEAGEILKQRDLAKSLQRLAKYGSKDFYHGEIAKKLSQSILEHGGIITMDDFAKYRVKEVEPVRGTYRGYEIASMPPPSSGGVHLIQMLNILEGFPMDYLEYGSAETFHLMIETMKLAYADRAEHLGDPEFWDVPVSGLASKKYADALRQKIDKHQATPSTEIKAGNPKDYESEETTHFTVADRWGNVVTNTYTLNFSFGTGLMAEGTGILLNNEMGDFSAKPGTPNAYGLIGGEANAVRAGKRPLSSMTPTIVLKDGRPFIATGSPGGSRIITTVLQIIINVIDHDMNIADATHAPRIHHQWYPDMVFYEKGISPDTRDLLGCKGHRLKSRPVMGSAQSILFRDGWLFGVSDPRRQDGRTLGY